MEDKQKNRGKKGLLSYLPEGKPRLFIILGAVLLGILLLTSGGGGKSNTSDASVISAREEQESLEQYTEKLKKEIAALCESVGGVSNVTVALTLESGYEYVYATDSELRSDSGGERSEIKIVTVGSGSSEQTVFICRRPPRIGGIGIVCRGGDRADIQRELIALLGSAYAVGTNKIYVAGR